LAKFNAITNPGGRPAGVKNKLQRKFLEDLAETWEREGISCLRIMVKEEPTKFVQVCAGLMSREVSLDVGGPLSDMSDEELRELLARFRDIAAVEAEPEKVLLSAHEVINEQSTVCSRAKKAAC
jgi:hypothetical protein